MFLRIIFRALLFTCLLLCSLFSNAQLRLIHLENDENNTLRKIDLYNGKEGYAAFDKWLGFTADSGKTYIQKQVGPFNISSNNYPANLTFGFAPSGVKAFNKDTLLLYGHYANEPSILYSTDQGNTFKIVYWSSLDANNIYDAVFDLTFPQNGNIGYAVQGKYILKTIDRGKTWVKNNPMADTRLHNIQGINSSILYAADAGFDGKLYKTIDGAATWTALTLPQLDGQPQQIRVAHFLSPLKGWINIASNITGAIYYTSDGGQSWIEKTDTRVASFSTVDMKFINDSIGYLLSGEFNILKTTDSARTWEPLPKDHNYSDPGYEQTSLFTYGDSLLWSTGEFGFLQFSSNAGGEPLPAAYFLVDTVGVMATGKVSLHNYSKAGYQFRWLINGIQVSSTYHSAYTHDPYHARDTIRLIATKAGISDTAVKIQYFDITDIPLITGFSPATAGEGSTIIITGTNLHGVTAVKFGGVSATSFTIISPERIEAIVGPGTSGEVIVSSGYAVSRMTGFTFIPPTIDPPPAFSIMSGWYGKVGSTLTINGSNFGEDISSNKVFFGTIQATILSANGSQITCIVPQGAVYGNITVLNTTTNLQTVSSRSFSVPFADTDNDVVNNFTGNSFRTRFEIPYSSSKLLMQLVAGDFDGDGRADLATIAGQVTAYYDSIRVYRNNGQGESFSFDLAHLTVARANWVSVADMNGDGKPDIVLVSGEISICLNTSTPGNISFASPYPVSGITNVRNVLLKDLDGDGKIDIVARQDGTPYNARIFKNNGNKDALSFIRLPIFTIEQSYNMETGDIDLDGKEDLLFYCSTNYNSIGKLYFFKNSSNVGEIRLDTPVVFDVEGYAMQSNDLHLIDYDNDNRLDIVVLNEDFFLVFRNLSANGSIQLASPVSLPGPPRRMYEGSVAANFIGSVKPDILTARRLNAGTMAFKNTSSPGDISAQSGIQVGEELYGWYGAVADMNNDGRPDYITSPGSAPQTLSIRILENSVGKPVMQQVCANTNTMLYTDVSGNNYKWQLDKGTGYTDLAAEPPYVNSVSTSNNLFLNRVPANWHGYRLRCVVDGNLYSSNFVLNVVVPPISDVAISVPSTSFCRNTPVTFTASISNAGSAYFYWQINGVTRAEGQSAGFTTTALKNNDQVRVIARFPGNDCSFEERDTSATLLMTESGVGPLVTITGPSGITCTDSISAYTAIAESMGSTPVYQWQINGISAGTNSPNFSAILKNGDKVKVFLTSNADVCNAGTPIPSNELTASITASVVHNTVISTIYNDICPNSPVAIAAISTPTGVNPTYAWKLNGEIVPQATGSTLLQYGIVQTSQVQAIATATKACAFPKIIQTNIITIQVKPAVTPAISITGNTTTVPGQSVSLTAVPINGGSNPRFSWEDSTTSAGWRPLNLATPTVNITPIISGHKIRCILTSSEACANPQKDTSETIVLTINAITSTSPEPAVVAGIRYYPSPATNTLIIDSLRLQDKWESITVFTLTGKLQQTVPVRNQQRITIPLQSLVSGAYIAVIRRKNGFPVYIKFIKL